MPNFNMSIENITESNNDEHVNLSEVSSIEMFLEIIKHSIDYESTWESLNYLWLELFKSPLPSDALNSYAQLLTIFNVGYDQDFAAYTSLKTTEIKPDIKLSNNILKLGEALIGLTETCKRLTETRKQNYERKYAWFEPSWLLADILAKEYPEELDPGIIIAKYLKLLFPEDKLDINRNIVGEFEASKTIRYGSSLHVLVAKVGAECIESSELPKKTKKCLHLALETILDPHMELVLPEGVTFNEIIEATIEAPVGFFFCWAREWWLKDGAVTPPINAESLKILLSTCTIIGAKSIKENTSARNKKNVLTLNLLWDLIFKINNSDSIEVDPELQNKLVDLFNEYTNIRRYKFCGVSPLDYIAVNEFYMFLDSLRCNLTNISDITILLSRGQFDFAELYLLPESDDPDNILTEFIYIQDMYILIFNKAIEDGFYELANSILALYLLGRAIFCAGRFVMGGSLEVAITNGLSLPGNNILKHTLFVLIERLHNDFASDPVATLSLQYLKQFVPQQAKLHVIGGGNNPERHKRSETSSVDVKDFLLAELGEDRWNKLSADSQNHLISAEILWRKTYAELGFGIKDCSGLISNCNKVMEKELVDRLSKFYFSEQYIEFVRRVIKTEIKGEPTLGWLVQMLSNYDRLSPELKQMLQSCSVNIQHDSDLLAKLQKLCRHRNTASHKDQYDMVKVVEFRKIYYQDRTIHKFIDLIE